VLTLFAGVLVDRMRRRPLMILADAVRGLALASIPIAFLLHAITLPQLFIVALVLGIGNVVFDIAYLAYVPSLVGAQDIVEANNKLTTSFSVALLAGPGLGGVLVQAFGAAQALAANAVSYFVSVATLAWVRQPEPVPQRDRQAGVFAEMGEGLRLVFGHRLLRSLVAMMTTDSFALQLVIPIFLVFFYRQLHLVPAQAGLIFAALGIGSIVGSLIAARAVARLGLGRAMAIGGSGTTLVALVPLALFLPAVPWLILVFFFNALLTTVMDIQQVSLRQALTPDRLQGRMNATFRNLFWGVWPIANFLGGYLADRIGAAYVFLIAAALGVIPVAIIVATPIGRLRSHQDAIEIRSAAADIR
jgi:MFS family permease